MNTQRRAVVAVEMAVLMVPLSILLLSAINLFILILDIGVVGNACSAAVLYGCQSETKAQDCHGIRQAAEMNNAFALTLTTTSRYYTDSNEQGWVSVSVSAYPNFLACPVQLTLPDDFQITRTLTYPVPKPQ